MKNCIFCNKQKSKKIYEDEFVFACFDQYPVSSGHVLIISKRHIATWFDTSPEERNAVDSAIIKIKKLLDKEYNPDGYNIGINCGQAAGQTIFHLHVHIIPRYAGDMENPRGGIRGVIPEKRSYP